MPRITITLCLLFTALSTVAARADDEAAWSETMALYQQRCGIGPESAMAAGARDEWDRRLSAGQTATAIRELADLIPPDCVQLPLAAALDRAEYRAALAPPPLAPLPQEDGTESSDTEATTTGPVVYGPSWVGRPPRFVDPAVYERRVSRERGAQITSTDVGYRGLPERLHGLRDFSVALAVASVVPVVTGLLFIAGSLADPMHMDYKYAMVPLSIIPYLAGPAVVAGIIVEHNRDPAHLHPPRGTKGQVSMRWGPTGIVLRF